jgi:hypothetical protein
MPVVRLRYAHNGHNNLKVPTREFEKCSLGEKHNLTKAYIAAAILITQSVLQAQSAPSPFVSGADDTYVEEGTLAPYFTTGPDCPQGNCVLGWTYYVQVDDSGNVNWLFSDYSTLVNWEGSSFTTPLPTLPVGDVYTTATVTFAIEPMPYPSYSAIFSDASITDGCSSSSPATMSSSNTNAVATFQFAATPCDPGYPTMFGLQVDGSSSVGLDWSIPSTPGYWSDTVFFPPPEIDYTVTLNYADPPPVPEPSYCAAVAFGLAILVWFRSCKGSNFKERS